ncbi:D-amino-acid transaminase [Alphaproteobacteria bacterium]|nr:D-amino-acid transaminase [Alphaproteobacteria bacterium]MDC0462028.1 D-amino-acid transaminase [Alphaproteobacteria bacterium]
MSRIAYVNGRYLLHKNASVHIEDRGYQFGDGVYEVVLVLNKKMIDFDGHFNRLKRSLNEISLEFTYSETTIKQIFKRLIRANLITNGLLYLQVTRGVAHRAHHFPTDVAPALVVTAKPTSIILHIDGRKAITTPDQRWDRRDIKTIQLLPNCIAKQEAVEQDAFEAIMVLKDGTITEGASSNLWMIDSENQLVTRKASSAILNGITKLRLTEIAGMHQYKVVERSFTVEEAINAKELFVTSATAIVTPIIQLDDHLIADGNAGPVAMALRSAYLETAV